MFFNCVEPAHDLVGRDYYDWHFTIRAGLGHHIIFPHVDSCLGVICQLPNNTVFAGHINGFYQNDYSPASHQNAFQDLIQQLNGATVLRAAVFGNIGDGQDLAGWSDYIQFPWANRVDFLSSSCERGIDVMFDVDSGQLQLMRYQDGRNFRQQPLAQRLANINLYTINGYQLITV